MSAAWAARNWARRAPLLAPGLVVVVHLVALAVLPSPPALGSFVVLEGASLVVCGVSLAGSGRALRTTLVCWAVALGLFGVVWLARRGTDRLWLVALTLVAVGSLVGYGLHRYERVQLGLVAENPENN